VSMPRYEEVIQRAGSLQALTGLTAAEFRNCSGGRDF
jgi:hypothetical protein